MTSIPAIPVSRPAATRPRFSFVGCVRWPTASIATSKTSPATRVQADAGEALSANPCASSRTPGHRWAWQTRSWSRGQIDPTAVLYQRVVSTASNPGPVVGGLEVDVSDVLAQDCGQWNLHP